MASGSIISEAMKNADRNVARTYANNKDWGEVLGGVVGVVDNWKGEYERNKRQKEYAELTKDGKKDGFLNAYNKAVGYGDDDNAKGFLAQYNTTNEYDRNISKDELNKLDKQMDWKKTGQDMETKQYAFDKLKKEDKEAEEAKLKQKEKDDEVRNMINSAGFQAMSMKADKTIDTEDLEQRKIKFAAENGAKGVVEELLKARESKLKGKEQYSKQGLDEAKHKLNVVKEDNKVEHDNRELDIKQQTADQIGDYQQGQLKNTAEKNDIDRDGNAIKREEFKNKIELEKIKNEGKIAAKKLGVGKDGKADPLATARFKDISDRLKNNIIVNVNEVNDPQQRERVITKNRVIIRRHDDMIDKCNELIELSNKYPGAVDSIGFGSLKKTGDYLNTPQGKAAGKIDRLVKEILQYNNEILKRSGMTGKQNDTEKEAERNNGLWVNYGVANMSAAQFISGVTQTRDSFQTIRGYMVEEMGGDPLRQHIKENVDKSDYQYNKNIRKSPSEMLDDARNQKYSDYNNNISQEELKKKRAEFDKL